MKKFDVIILLSAILMGPLLACSMDRWVTGMERGTSDVLQAKKDLIASAGLFELHNRIYSRVGPHAWETRVKPEFMSRITVATVQETGNLFPAPSEVIGWVRGHPQEARDMLERVAIFDSSGH